MATQKHTFDSFSVARTQPIPTAPTPPARERVPMSFHSTMVRSRTNSPYSSGSSTISTIASSVFPPSSGGGGGGGSDTNLSQVYSANGSMRRQLLQRLWSREFQRFNRTGSVSPPMQRSQRSRRAWRTIDTPSPSVCLECQKLESMQFNRSVSEVRSKRTKYNSSLLSSINQKAHSIETETVNSSVAPDIETPLTTASSCYDENRNFTASASMDNGNAMIWPPPTSSPLTAATTTNMSILTTTTTSSPPASSGTTTSESTAREHPFTNAANVSETNQQCIRSDKNSNYGTVDAASFAEHDNGVRLLTTQTTPSPTISIDQSTIDSFISQILVDSLNNIIVVEGKVSGPSADDDNNMSGVVHTVSTQMQTDASMPMSDDNHSNEIDNVQRANENASHHQKIYFPKYATDDSMSEYSAQYSNDSTAIELPSGNILISVISGSAYPLDGGELIVHRYTQLPRTESLEVRPSSGSIIDCDECVEGGDDDDEGDDEDKTIENCDDDNVSLIDSLDDPTENNRDLLEEASSTVRPEIEKSKAFFVPMSADVNDVDALSEQETPDINIGDAMPERLRERLQRRQMEMNRRREYEIKRKQEQIQRIIDQSESRNMVPDEPTATAYSEAIIKVVPVTVAPTHAKVSKKKNNKLLRTEIGLLESYTVDAKGNLLFREPQKMKAATVKKTTLTSKRGPMKTITKPIGGGITRKPREMVTTKVVSVKRTNAVSVKPLANNRHRPHAGRRTDVQKMTLYHHSPADMVTPDTDCGPRRMYQKTEINDGKKRIEILEIVECVDSSPESLASTAATSPTTTTVHSKSSRIPIPVPPQKKSIPRTSTTATTNSQRLAKTSARDTCGNSFAKNLHQLNHNSRVDQIIADLLIEALNSSTDIGIEFVKTPQPAGIVSQSSLLQVNNTKRINLSNVTSANGRTAGGNGKRSAHSSGKYQQVFDAIPEERSTLSMDSPENVADPRTSDTVSSSIVFTQDQSIESKDGLHIATTAAAGSQRNDNGQAKGKAAIHSDQEKPEAWFGCFGQRHNESPIDVALLDEGIFKVTHTSSVIV